MDFSTSTGEIKRPYPESKRSHLDVQINRPVTSVQYDNPPSSESDQQLERSMPDYEVPSNTRFVNLLSEMKRSNNIPKNMSKNLSKNLPKNVSKIALIVHNLTLLLLKPN